jgi:transcriptional regulator with XRE-family HTH domain
MCKVVEATDTTDMNLGSKEKLAKIVKQARGERSYRAYGRLLGVSGTTVQGWENLEYVPERENLAKIAAHAGYTLTELILFLDEKPLPSPATRDRILQQMRRLSKTELVEVMEAGVKLLASGS